VGPGGGGGELGGGRALSEATLGVGVRVGGRGEEAVAVVTPPATSLSPLDVVGLGDAMVVGDRVVNVGGVGGTAVVGSTVVVVGNGGEVVGTAPSPPLNEILKTAPPASSDTSR
jgi:hypothetical protein